MNPEELLEQAEQDLLIDYTGDIGYQASKQPNLFVKYTKLLKKETQKLKVLELKSEKLQSELWLYYTGKAEPSVYRDRPMDTRYLKSEVKEAMGADELWTKLKIEKMMQTEIVDTLERIVNQVKDRAWTLKNVIEWKKFMEGM